MSAQVYDHKPTIYKQEKKVQGAWKKEPRERDGGQAPDSTKNLRIALEEQTQSKKAEAATTKEPVQANTI